MYNSRDTLIPVIGLSRWGREHPILQEERLVTRKALFEEMGFASLILAVKAILVEDGINFLFGLGGDVEVQVLVTVGDVLAQINLARVDVAGEGLAPVVHNDVSLLIHLG